MKKTADQLHTEIRATRQSMRGLLRADGRLPYEGTKARAEYDRLADQEVTLFEEWDVTDRAERNAAKALA